MTTKHPTPHPAPAAVDDAVKGTDVPGVGPDGNTQSPPDASGSASSGTEGLPQGKDPLTGGKMG